MADDPPMSSLFAPPNVPGDPQAQAMLAAWNAQNRPLRGVDLDTLRMPNEYEPGLQQQVGGGQYGSVPQRQQYRDSRGQMSSDVLRAAAMGSPYNLEARRNAIAQRVAANEKAKAEEAAKQQQLMAMLTGGQGYANPYAAGMNFGQGLGTQSSLPSPTTRSG